MRSFVFIPATSLLVFSIIIASLMNVCQGLSSTTQKPVYLYYKEIAVITDKLATWKPSKNPNDLPGAYKDLQALSAKLNETTDVVQKYPGKFDEQSAISISQSLDKVNQDVLKLDGNIKDAKEIFIGLNTTSQIVQILQSFGNQFSILFDQTEKHFPSDQCEKIRESDAQTICAIQDATAYLDEKACLPQGRVFCSAYENGHPIPIDPKRICTNNQLGLSETYYIENGGSS